MAPTHNPNLPDAIDSPWVDEDEDALTVNVDVEINNRRAMAENAEALRLARAL